jgi:hypothetical protein
VLSMLPYVQIRVPGLYGWVVAAYSDLEPSMLQAVAHLDDIDAMPGQLPAALGDCADLARKPCKM